MWKITIRNGKVYTFAHVDWTEAKKVTCVRRRLHDNDEEWQISVWSTYLQEDVARVDWIRLSTVGRFKK